MLRGEVWRADLRTRAGHSQGGIRPVVLIQNDAATGWIPTVLVIPFTSQLAARRFPGTLVVQPDATNGLTTPSVALTFQTTVLDKSDLLKRLGVLDDVTLAQIVALLHALTS